MDRVLDIAGLGIAVRFTGESMPIAGNYSDFVGRPDAHIEVHLDWDRHKRLAKSPNFPAFASRQKSATAVHLSRFDAEGVIGYAEGEPVHAAFTIGAREMALEAVIRVTAAFTLPRHDGLVMHSSAIRDQRGAHVFAGVSGAGKSTIAAMLKEHWPVELLSDELLILRKIDGRWHTVVSPFVGSTGLPHGQATLLESINFLKQAKRHEREPHRPAQALPEFCRHILTYAQSGIATQNVLDLAADVVECVPCYMLNFAKDPSVGEVLGLSC